MYLATIIPIPIHTGHGGHLGPEGIGVMKGIYILLMLMWFILYLVVAIRYKTWRPWGSNGGYDDINFWFEFISQGMIMLNMLIFLLIGGEFIYEHFLK